MRLLRCRVCSETYLGTDAPSRCPFCGAEAHLFVEAADLPLDINDIDPTEVERADLARAIELETSNARFYLAMSRQDGNPALASVYKRLSRIEAEHCSVFCKLAKAPKPAELATPSDASDDWCENIAESLARENTAAAFYAEAAGRATNPRVREVFEAVSAVERDHIEVDGLTSGLASCE